MLGYEDGGHYSENVDRKGGQKLNKVDRKFRMTPKMTVKVPPQKIKNETLYS